MHSQMTASRSMTSQWMTLVSDKIVIKIRQLLAFIEWDKQRVVK